MEELHRFNLRRLKVNYENEEIDIGFHTAKLYVDTSDFIFSWFVDISYIDRIDLLERLSEASNIQIFFMAVSDEERQFSGSGYMHPNLPASSASIRGDGILFGYEEAR